MMERTEPTFVPEWLKNSDDKSGSRFLRNKSLDSDLGRPTTSSYFRRPCSSNGSTHLRSYSSFGRTRDRDRDRNKEKTENWNRDYSDSLANVMPSWFEKDGVRRSRSNVSAKRVEFDGGRVTSPVLSSVIVGDVWTSALAEAPLMVATNGRNMAETLAQGCPQAQTASQLLVGTQRLEELAVKRSRQLIPMTPMPKSLSLNSSDKLNTKFGGQPQNPRPLSVNADKTSASPQSSAVGKLHVLKPSRERNNTSPIKETSSPTGGSKLPNSPLATPEKRPSPQARSRNDFFNLMRKKSTANNSSALVSTSNTHSTESANDTVGEGGTRCFSENKVVMYSEEEEARFLRSLGWEETTEEEGLTEEEINSFYKDVSKYVNMKTGSTFFKGTQPKCLMPLMGKNGDTKVDC